MVFSFGIVEPKLPVTGGHGGYTRYQCTVGLEGGSRRHSTVRQPDSQGSQKVFLVAPCCSDLTVVYANDVLVYGLTLTRPRFDEDW